MNKTIKLPCYGIVVTFAAVGQDETAWLDSDLSKERFSEGTDKALESAIDGIESMILAHAIAGVDIESPAYLEGIETAVEAVANHI